MKKLKLPKFSFPRRTKKLQATTAVQRRAPVAESYYDEEPKTNLSSAFIVVLILHVVAVGGIYTFNSIRASRPHNPVRNPATLAASAVPPPLQKTSTPATPAPEPIARKSAPAPVSKMNVHHVQGGDTLTKIAALHNVTVSDLEETNGIKAGGVLRPGQVLTIPTVKSAPKPVAPAVVQDSRKAAFLSTKAETTPTVAATANVPTRAYTVVKGDTPTSIAKKFNITSTELLKLNKLDDPKKMQAGQTLKVPAKKN